MDPNGTNPSPVDKPRLGVAILGCGQAAQALHLPALASLPTLFAVRHVVDASLAVAKGVADRYGARSSSDHREALKDPNVDVVLITAPDMFHAGYTIDACRAGKRAVLVEKPMALTPGDAAAVARVSAETGVPVAVGTFHRYDTMFLKALQHLPERMDAVLVHTVAGSNPEFRADQIDFLTAPPDHPDSEYFLGYGTAAMQLAGVDAPPSMALVSLMLVGLASHDLPLLRATLGEAKEVEAFSAIPGGGYQVLLAYEKTKVCMFAYVSKVRHVDWRFEWLSQDRVVELRFPQPWGASEASELSVIHSSDGIRTIEHHGAHHETGFRNEWRHLYRVVTEGIEPLSSAKDAALDIALSARIVAKGANKPPLAPDATRIALLGAGWIAGVHGPLLAAMSTATISHVLSRTSASAERRAWRYSCEHGSFEDLPAVLRSGEVDAVVVAGPPALHAEHTLAALAAGRDVIVEKPLARTLGEANAMRQAAKSSGRRVGYAENWAFAPVVEESVRLVQQGAVGKVTHVEVRALHSRPAWGSFLTPEWGGGALYDLGAHPLYWALGLVDFAEVRTVRCELTEDAETGSDVYGKVEFTTATGVSVNVEVSWAVERDEDTRVDASVRGDNASLVAALHPKTKLELTEVGKASALPFAEERSRIGGWFRKFGYLQQLEHFVGCFRDQTEPRVGLAEGERVLELIMACYASAGRKQMLAAPFDLPRDRTPRQLWKLT